MAVLDNRTSFMGELLPCQEASGQFVLVVIVKATYVLDENHRLVAAQEQLPVVMADAYRGEAGRSSLLHASDLALFKASTDVVLVGHAHAPRGTRVRRMYVGLSIGPCRKRVLVHGDRVWHHRMGTLVPSDATWFSSLPLVYERAFGGVDGDQQEARNPVGVGFRLNRPDAGSALPNIEDPSHPVAVWSDHPTPQGFGFIAADWLPRKALAGTYDAQWKENQFPLLPTDFDEGYFQTAHPDLRCAPHLRGDEQIELEGVSPDGPLRFALPGNCVALSVQFRTGKPQRRMASLDTVTLYPDHRAVTMVWRYRIPCPRRILDVETVTAFNLRLSTLRRLSHAPD